MLFCVVGQMIITADSYDMGWYCYRYHLAYQRPIAHTILGMCQPLPTVLADSLNQKKIRNGHKKKRRLQSFTLSSSVDKSMLHKERRWGQCRQGEKEVQKSPSQPQFQLKLSLLPSLPPSPLASLCYKPKIEIKRILGISYICTLDKSQWENASLSSNTLKL